MKVLLFVFLFLSIPSFAQKSDLATRANTFLSLLDGNLKAKAQYPLDHDERLNWHFVPRSRNGVCFKEFNDAQRDAAMALLKSCLSEQGYQKATAIIALENVLRVVENRGANDTYRDPLNYYLTIFGTPSTDKPWGWRFEGHHLAINFSSVSGVLESATPAFWGSNPGTVLSGDERGKQVLKMETGLGFTLINSCSKEQLAQALLATTAPAEIISFDNRKALPLEPVGLRFTAMTTAQQKIFRQLLDTYVRNYELGFSSKLMAKIEKAGMENLSFAWAGSLQPGVGIPYYYRIQGPMLLIELDNTQNNANHVHATVRDLTNDFGEDILREHYEREHQKN